MGRNAKATLIVDKICPMLDGIRAGKDWTDYRFVLSVSETVSD